MVMAEAIMAKVVGGVAVVAMIGGTMCMLIVREEQ